MLTQRLKLALFLLSTIPAFPQGQAIDGIIEGTITSRDRAAIPNSIIRVLNRATAYERKTVADEGGRYRIVLLPPGTYTVTVESPGFATQSRENVELRAGQTLSLDAQLEPSTVSTVVNVTEALPAVEVGRIVQANTYEERVVRAIPTPGRSIQDFYTLHPGVNAPPLSTGGSGTGTASTVYGGLGLRQINVDGTSNQLQGGARNLVISQDAIAEFQTVTNFSAEFGRVAGGIQNAFTRSGSNEVHGSGFLFARHRALSARPFLLAPNAPAPDFARYNYGGTIAGPIKKDRLFYFGSYERWFQDLPAVLTITPANAQALGIPASSIGANIQTFRAHTVTSRLDANINEKNRMMARFNYYYDRESPLGNGLRAAENLSRFDEDPWSLTTQNVTFLRSNIVNEFRFQYASRSISNGVVNEFNPEVNVAGVGRFNGNGDGTFTSRERGFQIINNTTFNFGRHSIKAGVDVLPVWFRERTRNVNGTFTFGGLPAVAGVRGAVSSLDQFLFTERGLVDPATNRPYSYTQFTQNIGKEFFEARVINQGYFIQDDFRATSRLKLNFGLRYEYFSRPEGNLNPALPATGTIPEDRNNIAPRFGFAYDIFGSGRTVIRGGYGIYYNTLVPQTFNTFLRTNGAAVLAVNVRPTDQGAPAFTRNRVPTIRPGTVLSEVRLFDNEFDNITVHSFFATVEREVVRDLAVSLTYQGNRARNLPYSINTNIRQVGTLADGRNSFTTANRPNPAFSNILVARSKGDQDYDGMVLTVTKRFSRGFYFQAAYHLSKAKGTSFVNDFTGFGILTSPSDPLNPAFDRGRSDFDMRNRGTFTGIWEPRIPNLKGAANAIMNGWKVSSRIIASNGFAHNATTGRDDNGDTVLNDRPIGIRRNDFNLPTYATVDLRLTRNFSVGEFGKLEIVGEVFNIAKRLNGTGVNTIWGFNPTPNANFRTITSAELSRQFQLAARFSF